MTNKEKSPPPTNDTKQTQYNDAKTAPTQAAALMVEATMATYPHAVQIIAKAASKEYNAIKATIWNTQNIIDRFDNDKEIPGLAKLNF